MSRLFRDWDVGFYQVPNWIKLVALFMLVFMAVDVCSPERCEAQLVPPASNSPTFVLSQQDSTDSDQDCCSFEEDCFNCAHFAPGNSVTLTRIAVIDFAEADLLVASLDRPPVLPYHPPRT